MWYCAQDLAGIPGMPGKERGIRKKANREHWESRHREAGKGLEYHIDSLPPETQAHLRAQQRELIPSPIKSILVTEDIASTLEKAASLQRHEQSLIQFQSMPEKAKNRADIKLSILRWIDETAREMGWSKAALKLLANWEQFSEWHSAFQSLSLATLYRWKKMLHDDGLAALAGQYQSHRASLLRAEQQVHDVFMATLHQHPTASAVHIRDLMQASLDPQVSCPALRSIQRWLADWRRNNHGTYAYMVNPDQARGRYRPAQGDCSEDVTRLLQRWELDSTPSDVLLNGQRYAVIGCIDVYSRRAKLLVTKTSKSAAIALLLRRCILDWGVPEEAKTDNGQDYIAKYLERVLSALEIEHTRCPPFSPWLKPHIERFFRTFSHGIAELLPGFIGHNVAEQQARRSRTFSDRFMTRGDAVELSLEPAQFQDFCDTWADGIYAQRMHKQLGCTPAQRWISWGGEIRRVSTERALDLLLAEAPDGEFRSVQKKGIEIGKDANGKPYYYIAPELGDQNIMRSRVRVLLDPTDLGKIVVLDGDFRFICLAECPELTGIDRRQVAAAARHLQSERLQTARQAMRDAAKKVKLVDALDAHLRIAAEKAKVIPIGVANEHQTPALTAAGEALQAAEPKTPTPLTAAELDHADALIATWEANQNTEEEPWERYDRLYRQQQAGVPITSEEENWMLRFAQTPEGQGLVLVLQADAVNLPHNQRK
jgi:putative transposase